MLFAVVQTPETHTWCLTRGPPAIHPSEWDAQGVTSQGLQPGRGSKGNLLPQLPVHRRPAEAWQSAAASQIPPAQPRNLMRPLWTRRARTFLGLLAGLPQPLLSPEQTALGRSLMLAWLGLSFCFVILYAHSRPARPPQNLLLPIKTHRPASSPQRCSAL